MLGAVGIEPTTSPEEIAPICRLQCDTTADCSIFNRFSRSARLSASSVESPTWRWCEIFQLLSAFWSFGVVSKIKRKSDGKILVWKELNYGKMSEKEK